MSDLTTTPSLSLEEIAAEEARSKQILGAMEAEGVSTTQRVPEYYFGFEETKRCVLPDGVSWVELKALNEGERKRYLDSANRDIRLQKVTGDAIMKMATGAEKHALLKGAIVGWQLFGPPPNHDPIAFDKRALEKFLDTAPPKIIDLIEKDVRKMNSWLMQDMSVEDLKKQIEELQEMVRVKESEEEGKAS